YAPTAVKVLDQDKQPLIEVAFQHLDTDPSFSKADFDREDILEETIENTEVSNVEESQALAVTFPLETFGAELLEKEEVQLEDGERVIMTFKGDRNFTLVQEKQLAIPTSTEAETETIQEVNGDLVNLGYGLGAITNNSVEWNYNGTDFTLASEDMTMEELIDVASSIQGQEVK